MIHPESVCAVVSRYRNGPRVSGIVRGIYPRFSIDTVLISRSQALAVWLD